MQGGKSVAWVGLVLGLSGCPGTDAPGVLDEGIVGGSSSSGPGITTFNSTVDPTLPPDGGSMEAESATEGTTVGVDGTTAGTTSDAGSTSSGGATTDPESTSSGGATTDPGSTSGSTSSGSATTDPGSTSAVGSTTDPTTGGGCNSAPGSYAYCLNAMGAIDNTPCLAPGDSTCLYTGALASPTGAVCSFQDCVDACDCPAAPATGTAVVSCDDVTGDPAQQFCYLDCGGGEACPTGMACFAGYLCVWPGPSAGGTPYGDCFSDPDACGLDGVCLNDGAMPTIGVCTEDCAVVGDCPASPGGTAPVNCQDITADGTPECFLNCSGGGSCPAGMTCFSNFLCAWN